MLGQPLHKDLAVDDLPLYDNHTAFLQPVQFFYQSHQILEGHVLVGPGLSSLAILTASPRHLA
jgi:hypothetical protein